MPWFNVKTVTLYGHVDHYTVEAQSIEEVVRMIEGNKETAIRTASDDKFIVQLFIDGDGADESSFVSTYSR